MAAKRKTSKKNAILKAQQLQVNKGIDSAIKLARQCSIFELAYFVHELHVIRLIDHFEPAKNPLRPSVKAVYAHSIDDATKYILALVAKYGRASATIEDWEKEFQLSGDLYQRLQRLTIEINRKDEVRALINLFKCEYNEATKGLRIDMSAASEDSEIRTYFEYFQRVDTDNDVAKLNVLGIEQLKQFFIQQYSDVQEEFLSVFGVDVGAFFDFNIELAEMAGEALTARAAKCEYLSEGVINMQAAKTVKALSRAFFFNKADIRKRFAKWNDTLDKMILKIGEFDPYEIRFHAISRNPIIEYGDYFAISPELLVDSLFINCHYALIEAKATKQSYMAKRASSFLDEISDAAKPYGFHEIKREFDLYEGKRNLGDIDLILENAAGFVILIEAKNHMLPLSVYFKDMKKTRDHLSYLKAEWEVKVLRRVEYLRKNHAAEGIGNDYKYILITRFPEIISHFSSLLAMSLQEFKWWLQGGCKQESFADLFRDVSSLKGFQFTPEEMESMRSDGIITGHFSKY
ncbi:hypothetical protein BH09SUM1_BH09SUM1_16240 [soil metagenome]